MYYAWRDERPYPPLYKDIWGLHTGLLDVRNNPKPAFRAFREAMDKLSFERPPLPPVEQPAPPPPPPLASARR